MSQGEHCSLKPPEWRAALASVMTEDMEVTQQNPELAPGYLVGRLSVGNQRLPDLDAVADLLNTGKPTVHVLASLVGW